jgi:hypothetical protein
MHAGIMRGFFTMRRHAICVMRANLLTGSDVCWRSYVTTFPQFSSDPQKSKLTVHRTGWNSHNAVYPTTRCH